MRSPLSVGVVGAGVSGLCAACHLLRQGHSVRVFEADQIPGGLVRSERLQGYLAEFGPSSMVAPPPPLGSFLGTLGLEDRLLLASRSSTARYVVRRGVPVRVPSDPISLLTTPLFSAKAKVRLLLEPFWVAPPVVAEESLGELIRRRLGQEFVDYALDPMVGGIFAGDPDRLSAAHALPQLNSLETRYGSLLLGTLATLRERQRTREPDSTTLGQGQSFSFRDGLAELPLAIAGLLGSRLSLRARVVGIHRLGQRWIIEMSDGDSRARREFDAVICAVPAHAISQLGFSGASPESFAALGEIRYAPVSVVVQGFRRERVAHPLDGFGLLVPRAEGLHFLGTVFSSSLFPERAPQGHVLLTTFVGGTRNPGLAGAEESAIASAVQADLHDLLGVQGEAQFLRVHRWRQAIPQYELGYRRFKQLVDDLEAANPGLVLAGNYRNGVSVASAMTSGYAAADALLQRGQQPLIPETVPSQ